MNERERLEELTRVTLEAHAASERFCKLQLAAQRKACQRREKEAWLVPVFQRLDCEADKN